MHKVGILGASGYAGCELLRICAGHPELDVVSAGAGTSAGSAVADVFPGLAADYPSLRLSGVESAEMDGLDLAFLALPHGVAAGIMEGLAGRVGAVVDLSGDFRLRDPADYSRWYGLAHPSPHLLESFAYGLPELFRDEIAGARLVAAPGCYVTAAALALAPLVRSGILEPAGIVVDAVSGVSGAGRGLDHATQFCTVNEDFVAYGLDGHRHVPEIEQVTGAEVLFTPHLAPMTRGIHVTCYARPARSISTEGLVGALTDAFAGEPFVRVGDRPPSTRATYGSNSAHMTARVDERSGLAVVLCALDNLVKGAAGQAVQCANLVLGIPEETGLARAGLQP